MSSALSVTVTSRIEEGIAVLELKGNLALGPALGSVREASQNALNAKGRIEGLILIVTGVNLVDSSGLGELTLVYTLAAKRNCPLRLVGPSASLKRMLEMTRIDKLLPSEQTLAEAIRSIKNTKRL